MCPRVQEIVDKALERRALLREEIVALLVVPPNDRRRHAVMGAANALTRELGSNSGVVAGQIGLNVQPCSADCAFCAYAVSTTQIRDGYELTESEVRERVRKFVAAGVHFVSLMATADYPFETFCRRVRAARMEMPDNMVLSANVGDFDVNTARELKRLGVGRIYHVIRLGEGVETSLDPANRIKTIETAAAEGLEIAFCIEPIGPEHTAADLADRMQLSLQFAPTACAVMRRIPLPGSRYEGTAVVPEINMAHIMAVLRLVYAHTDTRTFYIHEPSPLGLISGANQICAESAANPRELEESGETRRGWTVERCRELLFEAGYEIRAEPNYPGSRFTAEWRKTCCS